MPDAEDLNVGKNHLTLSSWMAKQMAKKDLGQSLLYPIIIIRGEPEYTRYRKRWSFQCKVIVVMRMRIRPHCTIDLRDNSSVGKA